MRKIIAALLMSILLISCGHPVDRNGNLIPTPNPEVAAETKPLESVYPFNNVYRYVDEEYGIICYVYGGYSIDCVEKGE